ncbi:hypothetical protein [Brachybacterium hainanense]|uniref:Uncharacterized protein n=1 Tax=Brachybacterium hainanense TaxID=1541174 RepID=A0ABV6RDD6_9MICO
MSNRRTRRAARRRPEPLSRAAFQRELIKAVDGDPTADPDVKAFWNDAFAALGGRAALSRPGGIEVLREEGRADG